MTMVNNVIGVVNYVIAARPSLLNFMIADTAGTVVVERHRVIDGQGSRSATPARTTGTSRSSRSSVAPASTRRGART